MKVCVCMCCICVNLCICVRVCVCVCFDLITCAFVLCDMRTYTNVCVLVFLGDQGVKNG